MTPHRLWDVIAGVDATHPGLSRLATAALVAANARIMMLEICPAGCGKSVVSRAIATAAPRSKFFDSITRSGLAPIQDQLCDYNGVIVVDDLGKIENDYSRASTMTTLVELVYSHYVSKHSAVMHIDITNFQGTAIVGCQPVVLKKVVDSPEWEATIMDKSLRFYHFWRPLLPNGNDLVLPQIPEVRIEDVSVPVWPLEGFGELHDIGQVQWSRGRVDQHLVNLLKSAAIWDSRDYVNEDDVAILTHIFRPMATEAFVFRKEGLGEGRTIDDTLLYLMVEWATHGAFTINDLCLDYKVSPATAYRVMSEHQAYWVPLGVKPERFAPSVNNRGWDNTINMVDVLRTCGIDWPDGPLMLNGGE